jgi:hypothetical protein
MLTEVMVRIILIISLEIVKFLNFSMLTQVLCSPNLNYIFKNS